ALSHCSTAVLLYCSIAVLNLNVRNAVRSVHNEDDHEVEDEDPDAAGNDRAHGGLTRATRARRRPEAGMIPRERDHAPENHSLQKADEDVVAAEEKTHALDVGLGGETEAGA